MSFTLDAAAELGIPEVLFWTTSACGFMGYVQFRRLIEKGLTPLKGTNPPIKTNFHFFIVDCSRGITYFVYLLYRCELFNEWVFRYGHRLDSRYERYSLEGSSELH
jgi:hypothetical protein